MPPSVNQYRAGVVLLIILAVGLRLPELGKRPMHGDEAVNAVKYAAMLEQGQTQYDPVEYHGPVLSLLTWPVSLVTGRLQLQDFTESMLRMTPVIFGVGLLGLILLIPGMGRIGKISSMAMLAVSPGFVFYSRYYIHEMLLVFFIYAALIFFLRFIYLSKSHNLFLSALALGLAMAVKETWIIYICSALLAAWLIQTAQTWGWVKSHYRRLMLYIGIILLVVIAVFSSLFRDMSAIGKLLESMPVYIIRGSAGGGHAHPWYQYLSWLTQAGETIFFLPALAGIYFLRSGKGSIATAANLQKFFAVYALAAMLIFTIIPYKTPWNLLGFWFACILLAGFGMESILERIKGQRWRLTLIAILIAGGAWILRQSYVLNYEDYCDPVNPYVYAHPMEDMYRLSDKILELTGRSPDRENTRIDVIAPGDDYWPLPWYLKSLQGVAWWNEVVDSIPPAPMIAIHTGMVDELIDKLYRYPPPGKRDLYLSLLDSPVQLRPGIYYELYARKEFLDSLRGDDK